ncbi:MAG: hypothetical protein MUC29_08380 [Pyrinomonadaceae bacterium]|jgi:hypothetical protein|nr:hypothetical protein [Pyrinomonadaceae bacterium]
MLKTLVIVFIIIFLTNCITSEELTEGQHKARNATKNFQTLYNEKKFEEIEAFRHSDLIKRVDAKEFKNRLEKNYQERGKIISTREKKCSAKGFGKTDIVASVSLHTTYEKGELNELFVWKIENDQVYLINYLIETELKF